MSQVVDPAVSRGKFDREIKEFLALSEEFGRRGWFLAEADFPTAFVLLATPQLKPAALITGVMFDFSDYDLRPPSVRLVDPFTREPWSAEELPTVLRRRMEVDAVPMGVQLPPDAVVPRMIQEQPLMQSYPGSLPFLCIAGVREYHDHSAHSGDAWELHRGAGAGRMVRILEIIDKYGLRPINNFNFALEQRVVGFTQTEAPE